MKHFSKTVAVLSALLLAAAFIGCSNPNSSDDSGTSVSIDDCTTAATEVTFADGNWSIKYVITDDGMSGEANIKATAADGNYTFTSGTGTQTVDLSKMMDADELTAFNAMTAEQKKAAIIEEMNAPENAEVTFNGNVVTIKAAMSTTDLAEMQKDMDLSTLPSSAVIKTNADNTKYTINFTKSGITYAIYISKD